MRRPVDGIATDLGERIPRDVLVHIADRLDEYVIPEPGPDETAALLAAILPRFAAQRKRPVRFRDSALEPPRATILRALIPQLRTFHPAWWVGSLLTLVACLALSKQLGAAAVTPAILAPPLVVTGIACGLRTLRGGALEMELSCPVTPIQAILSRMLVVLVYLVGLGFCVAFLGVGSSASLLLAWCASLLLFAGLMLFLTMRVDSTMAGVVSAMLWAVQLLFRQTRLTLFSLPGTAGWVQLQIGALVCGLALLALLPTGLGQMVQRRVS